MANKQDEREELQRRPMNVKPKERGGGGDVVIRSPDIVFGSCSIAWDTCSGRSLLYNISPLAHPESR